MAKPGSLPKFGDWTKNNQAGTEYTMVFDNARSRKPGAGGPSALYNNSNINPNDPYQNPEAFENQQVAPPEGRQDAGTGIRTERREERKGKGEERIYRSPPRPPKGETQGYAQQRDQRRYHSPAPPPNPAGIPGYGQSNKQRERDAVVPPFGAWDETNPRSGDEFTGTFEKVERQSRRDRGAPLPTYVTPSYPTQNHGTTPTRRKEKKHWYQCSIM